MRTQDITIRLAVPDDAEALLNIYRYYVEKTVVTFECTVPSVEEFRERITRILRRHPYLVADTECGIVGYAYASDFKDKDAYVWAAETTIYIDKEWLGCGVGTVLYSALEQWLTAQNIIMLYACITFPNPRSIQFHKTFRYREAAKFRKCAYKKKRWLSIIWMQKEIGRRRRKPDPPLSMNELKTLMQGWNPSTSKPIPYTVGYAPDVFEDDTKEAEIHSPEADAPETPSAGSEARETGPTPAEI